MESGPDISLAASPGVQQPDLVQADARSSTTEPIAAGGILAALVVLRSPQLFVEPRFWAEEGVLYFAYAHSHDFWTSLFAAHAGYYNFTANLAGALATLVPLAYAPTVTTFIAFLVHLATALVAFTSRTPFTDTRLARWVAAVGVLLLAPTQVWLTTISAQFWLAIAAFFILAETAPRRGARAWLARVVLAIGALTAGVTCFLAPLFAWRAHRRRDPDAIWQAGVVAAGCVVQVVAVVGSFSTGDTYGRLQWRPFPLLPWLAELGNVFQARDRMMHGGAYTPATYALSLLVVGVVVVVAIAARREAAIAWTSAAMVLVPSVVFSIRMVPGEQYVFVPSVMVFAGLVRVARRSCWTRWPAIGIVLLALGTAAGAYRSRVFHNPAWTTWRSQVRRWDGRSPLWIPPPMKSGPLLIHLSRE
jgi:hypothetical protein